MTNNGNTQEKKANLSPTELYANGQIDYSQLESMLHKQAENRFPKKLSKKSNFLEKASEQRLIDEGRNEHICAWIAEQLQNAKNLRDFSSSSGQNTQVDDNLNGFVNNNKVKDTVEESPFLNDPISIGSGVRYQEIPRDSETTNKAKVQILSFQRPNRKFACKRCGEEFTNGLILFVHERKCKSSIW